MWEGITAARTTTGDGVEVVVGPSSTATAGDVVTTFGPIDYPDSYDTPLAYVQGAERRRFAYPAVTWSGTARSAGFATGPTP